MTDLTQQVEEAREKGRERLRDLRNQRRLPAGAFWMWLDRLIDLERAEAGLHWVEHLKDHNEGMCAACYLEGVLEAAITAIMGEHHDQ